ncbi:hypothetical protein [Pedosphaera parvula]|uniref:Uncharacterized protein n=1 Tax=Pedosphaera parvula (strain Ellin514) TaxID=320771 RepID=B9XHX4_PEDPL|nr:hypothetical protein [Pedosphaera parvula]EEF60467.1 hypothetical protein Cflav_PD3437 [Pedosphaera parvula Ellin514]
MVVPVVALIILGLVIWAVQTKQADALMKSLARTAPFVSFVFCILGGVVLVLDGIDQENGFVCGIGLFFIGMAFFVGPMLWLVAEKYRSKPNDK